MQMRFSGNAPYSILDSDCFAIELALDAAIQNNYHNNMAAESIGSKGTELVAILCLYYYSYLQ